jgi:small subunit ribosomal protein S10e
MMQSFRSKGFVREQFNWQYFYWFLTNEGIEYLRTYLHLPEDVVPNTLKKPKAQPKPAAPATDSKPAPTGRGKSFEDKKATPSADFKPEFVRLFLN